MKCWDKLDEFQSEMFAKLIDYVRKNGNNELVKFDENGDMLYFHIANEWVNEYDINIFDLAEVLDILEIKCTWGD